MATAAAVAQQGAPLIPLTVLDLAGGLIMVTYRYLSDKILKPHREKIKAQAREEGLAQGIERGVAAERQRWCDWLPRGEAALVKGEPFDEPPPEADAAPRAG